VRRALVLQERAQAGDADMVRSLSVLSKIYLARGKTQLGTELADKAAKRLKRLGTVQRTRNTRARLDRDTPDFSVDPGAPPSPQPGKPAASRPPLSDALTPSKAAAASATPSTPNRSGSPSAPSTPATVGLMRSYAQMIENAGGARHGQRRSWWSRLFSR